MGTPLFYAEDIERRLRDYFLYMEMRAFFSTWQSIEKIFTAFELGHTLLHMADIPGIFHVEKAEKDSCIGGQC